MIFVRIVGCIKAPSLLLRVPPKINFAPASTALLTCSAMRTAAASLESGPSSVFGSIGSPMTKFFIFSVNFVRNSSVTSSKTINRFEATQHSPLLLIRPIIPHLTALSISASSRTIKASLPPSSKTDFLMYFPACSAILDPASSLPVSETPLIRVSETNAEARFPEICKLV